MSVTVSVVETFEEMGEIQKIDIAEVEDEVEIEVEVHSDFVGLVMEEVTEVAEIMEEEVEALEIKLMARKVATPVQEDIILQVDQILSKMWFIQYLQTT